jgi:hypothetical protein
MSLTKEQARIAQAIDGEFHRRVKEGKSQATILGLMHGHMPLFKQLMDAGVMQEAAERYPGFRQFAKVLERTARGIQSGAIAVPGRRAEPPSNDPMSEYRRLAADGPAHGAVGGGGGARLRRDRPHDGASARPAQDMDVDG